MFTAEMARSIVINDFDEHLKAIVEDAKPETQAYIKVYWGPNMERRAEVVSAKLQSRGFRVTEIRDLDSFRFAEVHFSWGDGHDE